MQELSFFSKNEVYALGLEYYGRVLSVGENEIGIDATPAYMPDAKVRGRIKMAYPDQDVRLCPLSLLSK